MFEKDKLMLKRHEGVVYSLYNDSAGKQTIGCGRNLTDGRIYHNEVELMLDNDIKIAHAGLEKGRITDIDIGDIYRKIDPLRKIVLRNMCFNLGFPRLSKFVKMWHSLKQKNYNEASKEMMLSRWARQVTHRAHELSMLMKRG